MIKFLFAIINRLSTYRALAFRAKIASTNRKEKIARNPGKDPDLGTFMPVGVAFTSLEKELSPTVFIAVTT